jgi:protein-tyrosine-phosphatase/DNA-binding transcriptional ArsR family regulator
MIYASPAIYPPEFLQLLGHEVRWRLLQALAFTDMHVQELVEAVKRPQNLVSYHLRKLHEHGVVREHRSIADGREVYYSLDLDRVRASLLDAGGSLHPALGRDSEPTPAKADVEGQKTVRVLFLCTHNSARSQIAEGILRSKSGGNIDVHSAGTEATQIHPLAVRALAEMNIDIHGQHSKSLEQFIGQHFDYIITVCDRAKESCPVFPGDPVRIHWSFPDPSAVEGTEEARFQAFRETSIQMMTRISYLLLMIQREHGLRLEGG